jgi:Zn finger protein HypA/HybF involved in hydrogenase expression
MSEYSLVQELVEKLLAEISEKKPGVVKEVRLRKGSIISEETLQQAFHIMTENTPLENVQLAIETFNIEHKCKSCGYQQVLTPDDLIGNLYVCPECGADDEIKEAQGLQYLGMA